MRPVIMQEIAFLFGCEGDELVGIISAPDGDGANGGDSEGGAIDDVGVLVVVGGPQYRVGSHRQFVLLARQLAAAGIPCMRFDYRGMGDATGDARSFERIDSDIRAAVGAFCARSPTVRRVVLWGLCDGASASCFYAPTDSRISGLLLLNPWVRTAAGEAKTYLKHYYLQRLTDSLFWKKLLGGGVSVRSSLGSLVRTARAANGTRSNGATSAADLPTRMARALAGGDKPFYIVLSGRDYVAREFEEAVATSAAWQALPPAMQPHRFDEADHTFSRKEWRMSIAALTARWVGGLGRRRERGHGGEPSLVSKQWLDSSSCDRK